MPTPAVVVSESLTTFCQSIGLQPDAVDRLLWDEFALVLDDLDTAGTPTRPYRVTIVNDESAALTVGVDELLAAQAATWFVNSWQDSFTARQKIEHQVAQARQTDHIRVTLPDSLTDAFQHADLVIGRLPKSLDALDELAELVAAHAKSSAIVLLAGRVKHMTPAMNDVLSRHFAHVQPHLGRQKSRTLEARSPHPADSTRASYPAATEIDGPFPQGRITVASHGGVFAGAQLDIGTRELLGCFSDALDPLRSIEAPRILDLGCGTGLLATSAALSLPQARVIATDDSWAAVRSTVATARSNNVSADVFQGQSILENSPGVTALWDNAAATLPDASFDLILCNPPFHQGTAVDTSVTWDLFAAAGRVLRPGGQMWTVFNRHLPYLPALRRYVGPTTVAHATPKFTVARSEHTQ